MFPPRSPLSSRCLWKGSQWDGAMGNGDRYQYARRVGRHSWTPLSSQRGVSTLGMWWILVTQNRHPAKIWRDSVLHHSYRGVRHRCCVVPRHRDQRQVQRCRHHTREFVVTARRVVAVLLRVWDAVAFGGFCVSLVWSAFRSRGSELSASRLKPAVAVAVGADGIGGR